MIFISNNLYMVSVMCILRLRLFLFFFDICPSLNLSVSDSHMYYYACLPAFTLPLICISFRLLSYFLSTSALLISLPPLCEPPGVKLIVQTIINKMRSYEAAQCSRGFIIFFRNSIRSHCCEILHISH